MQPPYRPRDGSRAAVDDGLGHADLGTQPFVRRLQAGSRIDGVAQRAVVKDRLAAQVADDDFAAMNANPRQPEVHPRGREFGPVAGGEVAHIERTGQRAAAMIRLRQGRREHDCDGVADHPVERAFVTEGNGDHAVEIAVEHGHGARRVGDFHQAREVGKVGKHEAAFAPLATQFQPVGVRDQVRDQIGRHVARERLADPSLAALGFAVTDDAGEHEAGQQNEPWGQRVEEQAVGGKSMPGPGEEQNQQAQRGDRRRDSAAAQSEGPDGNAPHQQHDGLESQRPVGAKQVFA
ncbi:MAG: hypothetical protein AW09_003070 [Candidatus Accumulibacter phosphatis]|uniref:Uncharacterized protein n=1 Tax=Candidatus Accumulibacter phosphatis TaxID=327160 RepID=A0A080LVP1_9PROT|nr:MAG: hypothetical protein AW09_003070 [Candidatus Accumulibacter phosphatis]